MRVSCGSICAPLPPRSEAPMPCVMTPCQAGFAAVWLSAEPRLLVAHLIAAFQGVSQLVLVAAAVRVGDKPVAHVHWCPGVRRAQQRLMASAERRTGRQQLFFEVRACTLGALRCAPSR